MKLLVAHGADCLARDRHGRTLLGDAAAAGNAALLDAIGVRPLR